MSEQSLRCCCDVYREETKNVGSALRTFRFLKLNGVIDECADLERDVFAAHVHEINRLFVDEGIVVEHRHEDITKLAVFQKHFRYRTNPNACSKRVRYAGHRSVALHDAWSRFERSR